jgi:hypothetical protein
VSADAFVSDDACVCGAFVSGCVESEGLAASEGFTGSLWQQRFSLVRLCSWRFS